VTSRLGTGILKCFFYGVVTKGPLFIFSSSLAADCKLLQIGGLLPGNADNVAVPGEHEAEGEDEAERGVDESEDGDVSPLRRTVEDCSTYSKIEG